MEDQIFSAILANTYTARKLQKRLRVLKMSLLSRIFGTTNQIGDTTEIEEEQDWLSSLSPELLAQINKDTVYPLFEKLETKIKNIEILTVYLALELPKEELARLASVLRSEYGSAFLFDIKFDPNIIAGASVVWKGIYKDYSVRSMIGERKNEILTEFRRFVGTNK